MSKTKEKILANARALFNERGLAGTSQRAIADHMGISPGNLTYHYKKRSQIIEALYFELVENIDIAIAEVSNAGPVQTSSKGEQLLRGLYHLTKVIMQNFYEYRFLMLDFIQLMRENERIKQHYTQLQRQREAQFSQFLQLLIDEKLMRAEEIPNEYSNYLKRQTII
ncbi:MAG: TetR/AcrR family transcriptional regulator, partial [Bacteroidota bacterium]